MHIDYYDKCKKYLTKLGFQEAEMLLNDPDLGQKLEETRLGIARFLKNPNIKKDDPKRIEYEEILSNFSEMTKLLSRKNFCLEYEEYHRKLFEKFDRKTLEILKLSLYDFYKFINESCRSHKNGEEITMESTSESVHEVTTELAKVLTRHNTNSDKRNFANQLRNFFENKYNKEEYDRFLKDKELYNELKDQQQIEEKISIEINKNKDNRKIDENIISQICDNLLFGCYARDDAFKYAKNFIFFRGYTIVNKLVDLMKEAVKNLDQIDILQSYKYNPPPLSENEIEKIKANIFNKDKGAEIASSLPLFWKLCYNWNGFEAAIVCVVPYFLFFFYYFAINNCSYGTLNIVLRGLIIFVILRLFIRYYKNSYNQVAEKYKKTMQLRWSIPWSMTKYILGISFLFFSMIIWGTRNNDLSEIFRVFIVFMTPFSVSTNILRLVIIVILVINLIQDPFHIIAKNKYYHEYETKKAKAVKEYISKRDQSYFDENNCSGKIDSLNNDPILSGLPKKYRNQKNIGNMIRVAIDNNLSSLTEVITKYELIYDERKG